MEEKDHATTDYLKHVQDIKQELNTIYQYYAVEKLLK
jgi:hypothetical protein